MRKTVSLCLALITVLLLASCGTEYAMRDTTIYVRVGKYGITADTYSYFFESYLSETPGMTRDEAAKESLEAVERMCAIYDICEKFDCGLSKDQKKQIETEMESAREIYKTEEEFFADLEAHFMSENVCYELLKYYELYDNVFGYLTSDFTGNIRADDATVEEDIQKNFYCAAQILIKNDSSDDIEANRAQAESLLGRIADGEDFIALAEEYSEDKDRASYTTGYYFTSGEMLDFFEKSVKGLAIGDVSEVVVSDLGFHIIKRLPLDAEYIDDNFDDLRMTYKTRCFNEQLAEIIDGYTVTVTDECNAYINRTGE